MTVIGYRDVGMNYGGAPVLEHLDLVIESGEFITIIGSSGCGKTTTLKMANGLLMPTSGEVLVNGKSTAEQDLINLRRQIGYAVQGNVLFPHLTVAQNIAYVPDLSGKLSRKQTRALVGKWMEIIGLDKSLAKRYPRELSGGQQQRVGIARALASEPSILLMDEPFSAVDEITRAKLQDELKEIHKRSKLTVMFVTHDIGEACKLGSKILIMDGGKIQQFDTPDAILNRPANEFVKNLVRSKTDACANQGS